MRKTPEREENGRQVSAPWSQQALSKQRPGPSAKATQRWRERAGGRGRERRAGEGRAADPTRGGDLRVCAGVALRRLPRRLGVDAGDDMARGGPARHTRGHAAPASGCSAAAQTPSQRAARVAGLPGRARCSDARGSRAALGGLRSEAALPQLTSLAPGFPPAAQSSPSSPPPAAPHQSQRRFRVAPPPRGATPHRQGGRSSVRGASQKAGAGLARCPPLQMV